MSTPLYPTSEANNADPATCLAAHRKKLCDGSCGFANQTMIYCILLFVILVVVLVMIIMLRRKKNK